MASTGKLDVQVEVKSHADKFWHSIRDSANIFPKAFPDQYKSIEVLEGDGKSVGSVSLITYGEGSPLVKHSKEKIEAVDEAKKSVSYSVIDGDLLKFYKSFKAHLVVSPKGDGSLVHWSCDYEKAKEDIEAPHIIKDFAVKNLKELDDYIHQA
ncbi:MLP-like protein 423 [Cornus florida]|uniref:MLP-like protein 423 n=1 Tax=Cornus florida TaxID=4283 RepID=UPI00289B385C|nr:MLP-like protein 423 [Cornus florida]